MRVRAARWPGRSDWYSPDSTAVLQLYGRQRAACIGLGDHEPVIGLYEKLLTGIEQSDLAQAGREGVHQWRHYERWLRPLADALGDALISYRNQGHRPKSNLV